ncbi:MAG: alpha/beta hydrolase [Pseudomonadota bacterium]
MEPSAFPQGPTNKVAWVFIFILMSALLTAEFLASRVQTDFGNVEVANVVFPNYNGIRIRAKLLRPLGATPREPAPGVVYIHGYQNNRETGDPYAIELARRGFVVLNIDAVGRGNSGAPGPPGEPDFDPTYGGKSAFQYLLNLPYVDPGRAGMMGHSLGAEMAYKTALMDPRVKALVLTGFAFNAGASADSPRNMLMIIGKWDEYRQRMTGVADIERDWMTSDIVRQVIPTPNPDLGRTYGDFSRGTARRVVVPGAIHIQVSHSREAVAEATSWMKQALSPPSESWVDPLDQIWPIKEWATLVALVAGLALVLPLGALLLSWTPFRGLRRTAGFSFFCSGRGFLKAASVNALLMWLYLPLIFVLFGLHIYVVPIDRVFPMMLLNAIVWWFFVINLIGLFLRKRWAGREGLAPRELGLGAAEGGRGWKLLGLDAGLALLLFFLVYGVEHILENIFIVDYRFIFPFAGDLTFHRALLCLLYFPFFYFGFFQTGVLVHGQMRRPEKRTFWGSWLNWSAVNTLVLTAPLVVLLLVQYVPLLATGGIIFVGPGGMLASFVMNLFHIIGVLILITPISTWFFLLTGRIRPGALIVALIVTWMMVSTQVIAPIPV